MQEQLNILEVYRHNNKNYLTGTSLLMIRSNEYILTENKNLLYETPQFIIDDLYYNMPNLDVVYFKLNQEQMESIYPFSYANQDKNIDKGYIQDEMSTQFLPKHRRLIKKK